MSSEVAPEAIVIKFSNFASDRRLLVTAFNIVLKAESALLPLWLSWTCYSSLQSFEVGKHFSHISHTSPPSGQGWELQTLKMTDGLQICPSNLKKMTMTEDSW